MAQARTLEYNRRLDPISGLVHKDCATVLVPTAPEQPVREQPATPATDPALIAAIGKVLASERKLARQERQQEIHALEKEIAELRGSIQTLLALRKADP